jgi:hypothetical protein
MTDKQELLRQFDEARGESSQGSTAAIVLLALRVLLIVLIDIRDLTRQGKRQ